MRDNGRLRSEVEELQIRSAGLSREKALLLGELEELREVLGESSLEMETCKAEFIRMGREKDRLLLRLRELENQRQAADHVRLEFEEEARSWRDKYYAVRR